MRMGSLRILLPVIIDEENSVAAEAFIVANRPGLERALVARYGLSDGLDAASHAIEFCIAHWERLSTMSNPLGYLFRVGHTHGLRGVRSRRRLTELVTDPVTTDQRADVDLQRALVRLSWEQRVAIVLVHAHGHTYADTARMMGMPVTTITNHVNRGLARLRRILEPRVDNPKEQT